MRVIDHDVFVFADYGGKTSSEKAGNSPIVWGDKVVAFTSRDSPDETKQLINLGADEVLTCEIKTLNEWVSMICEQVQSDSNSKIVLFPSNTFSNALMGMIHAQSETFAPFADQAEILDGETAGKKLGTTRLIFGKS